MKQDCKEAVAWYRKAAKQGMHMRRTLVACKGVPQDFAGALKVVAACSRARL